MKIEDVIEEERELFNDACSEYERDKWFGEGTLEDHLVDFVLKLREEEK